MNGIGSRIREARKAAGLTQEQLAEACGWSGQSRVGNYEAGKREPSAADMGRMAKALGVSPSYLWEGVEPSSAGLMVPAAGSEQPIYAEQPAMVPVVDLATLADVDLSHDFRPAMTAIAWTICPVKHGNRTFAFRITDDSMTSPSAKSIPKGFFVWVDPDRTDIEHDRPVLAKLAGGELIVAQYMNQAGRCWLHLLNPAYPPLAGAFTIVGRVIFKGEET